MFNEETAIKPAKFSKNHLLKVIACILVFALLFTSLPTEAFDFAAKAEELEIKGVYVVKEVEDYRTQNSKTYLKSDGSMTGIISSEALHFKEGGEWKEIDNTLCETENGYKNTAGELEITLPDELNSNSAVTVSNDEYSISFSHIDIVKSTSGKIKNASKKTKKSKFKDMTPDEITKASETMGNITYSGVYENSNIRYDVQSNKLKESIVLDKKPNKHLKYTYTVTAKGLSAELLDNNVIEFFTGEDKTRKVVFSMPAPYMYDSSDIMSHNINVNLKKLKNYSYLITYSPDENWLKNKDRVYPVVIDPTIVTCNYVATAYVASDRYQYSMLSNEQQMKVGNYDLEFLSYVKFGYLSPIPEDYNIAKANMYVAQRHCTNDSVQYIASYDVAEEWFGTDDRINGITYSTKPNLGAATDYQQITSPNEWLSFDVTDIAKRWFSGGTNYGICLKVAPGISGTYMSFHSANVTGYKPYLEIEYAAIDEKVKNYKSGIRTFDVSRAGVLVVNNYLGSVQLKRTDIGIDGNIMPVSISMIYSSDKAYDTLADSSNISAYGSGFTCNYNMSLTYDSSNDQFVFIDKNNSSYTFKKQYGENLTNDKTYINSSGDYTLFVGSDLNDESFSYIEDLSKTRYYFDNLRRITKIVGYMPATTNVTALSTGNEYGVINITYIGTTTCINTITDGTNRKYQFVYDDHSNLLTRIDYYGTGTSVLRSVLYEYNSNGSLCSVEYADGAIMQYIFDNGLLTSAQNTDGSKTTINYDGLQRVSSIRSYNKINESIEQISITRDDATNSIKYSDYKDSIYFNPNGVEISYLSYGMDDSLYQNINVEDYVQPITHNFIFSSIATQNFADWTLTNGEVDTTESKIGTASIKLISGDDTEATMTQDIRRIANGTHVFSAYVKKEPGATVDFCFSDNVIITNTKLDAIDDIWSKISCDISCNSNFTCGLSVSNGIAWVDGIQLISENSSQYVNLVQNGIFNASPSNKYWNIGSGDIAPTSGYWGNDAVQFEGCLNDNNIAYQEIAIDGFMGDILSFGALAKVLEFGVQNAPNREFAINVKLYDDDELVSIGMASFNPRRTGIQTSRSCMQATANYNKIRVELTYRHQLGVVNLYAAQVFRVVVGSGEIIPDSSNTDEQPSTDDGADEEEYVDPYIYDSYNRPTQFTDDNGNIHTYSYDAYNNELTATYTADSLTRMASTTYSNSGNYISSEQEQDGTINYIYDEQTGNLLNKQAGNTLISYSYNQLGEELGVSTNVSGLVDGNNMYSSVTYDNSGNISTISKPNLTYTFDYTANNQLSSFNIGSINLFNSIYTNKQLTRQNFGNSQSINYSYDDNMTKIMIGGNTKYLYETDLKGNVIATVDYISNRKTTHEAKNRKLFVKEFGFNGNDYSHSYTEYATPNNTTFVETIGTRERTIVYENNPSNKKTVWNASKDDPSDFDLIYTNTHDSIYDNFGRKISETVDMTARLSYSESDYFNLRNLSTSYTYNDTDNGITSGQIKKIEHLGVNGTRYSKTFEYDYNELGLIISENNITYVYDQVGQLIRINDPDIGTVTYAYDTGGNIRTKTTYSYTQGSLDGLTGNVVEYIYADSNWKDKLTGIQMNSSADISISYDGAGNPINYGDMTFSWEMGHRLSSVLENNILTSYKYDKNGLRTEKTVGNTKTVYSWANGMLTHQSTDGIDIHFIYDHNNEIIGLEDDDGEPHYFVKNQQGDVIAILSSVGFCLAQYKYDAWGNIISIKDGDGNNITNTTHIAHRNPIRYRGYYYDTETNLYYIESRYYDPSIGRFISPDIMVSSGINKGNLYQYCNNNPINMLDIGGLIGVAYAPEYSWEGAGIDTALHFGLSMEFFYSDAFETFAAEMVKTPQTLSPEDFHATGLSQWELSLYSLDVTEVCLNEEEAAKRLVGFRKQYKNDKVAKAVYEKVIEVSVKTVFGYMGIYIDMINKATKSFEKLTKYLDNIEKKDMLNEYFSFEMPVGTYRVTIAKYIKISSGNVPTDSVDFDNLIVRYKVEGPVGSPLNQPWRLVPAYNEVKEAKIKNLEHYVTGAWRYP